MRTDSKGDMGFMEAMLSAMAVITVLMAFIGSVSTMVVVSDVSMEGFDTRMLKGEISDGVFQPFYVDYLYECRDLYGYSSVTVKVTIPGGFCEEPEPVSTGGDGGFKHTLFHTDVVHSDKGRSIPVFYEVVLCKMTAGE